MWQPLPGAPHHMCLSLDRIWSYGMRVCVGPAFANALLALLPVFHCVCHRVVCMHLYEFRPGFWSLLTAYAVICRLVA
jgi:hypothetical protein